MVKISIIVPVYNVEQYLKKCLDSLVFQTLQEIEIIIVNDGTKDNSQQIIDSYVSRYPHKVFSYMKENGGLSSARNYGLKKAKGAYVAFVDSDDWVDVNMYKLLYDKVCEQQYDMVCCNFNEIRNDIIVPCSCNLSYDLTSSDQIKEAMVNFYPSAWNKIYKKSLLDELGIQFKQNVWFEDVEFMYRLLPYVQSIGVVHENLYQYLIREGSITSMNDSRIYDYIKNWNGLLMYYKENNIFEEYHSIIEYCYVRYLYATFVKSACKFDKEEYKEAVRQAIASVNDNFPHYRRNQFIKRKGFKNLYLKYFSRFIANVIYQKYHT